MSPSTLVAGVVVKLGGSDLDPKFAKVLSDVRVTQSLNLPDLCTFRIQDDMKMTLIDSHPFDFGKELEILLQPPEGDVYTKVFKGEVVTVEGEFEEKGVYLAVRAYGKAHRMNRAQKNEVYLDKSYSDIAGQLAGAAGLSSQTDADPAGSRKFVQQSNETDWAFLARLASQIGFMLYEREGKLYFTKADNPTAGGTKPLEWGKELQAFRPRMTGVQQVEKVTVRGWDPAAKRAITATASSATVSSKIGLQRSKAQSAFGASEVQVGAALVLSEGEAKALAESTLNKQANAYLEATGTVVGKPDLKAGDWVEIKGVGSRFSGKYLLSEVVHTYAGAKGFTTNFRISGQTPRGIVETLGSNSNSSSPSSSPTKADWATSIVVGIVTNNNDPDGLGRVKVKFPTLGDQLESWWARIASPSAGKDRGLLMMPIANDEVLVAFEHGDPRRPYVIGSLWNGQAKPNNLVQKDGSFVLQSDKQIQMKAKQPISVKGDKEISIDTTGAAKLKTSNKLGMEASSDANLKAMKIEINASADITIKANAAVKIQASGQCEVSASGMLKLSGSTIMIG
jgi:uncharacterized protein involved in type VI secretion and phage assembly